MAVVEKQFGETLMGDLPRDKWRKAVFKMPLYAWGLGLRYFLPPSFACITTRGRTTGLPRHTIVEHGKIVETVLGSELSEKTVLLNSYLGV